MAKTRSITIEQALQYLAGLRELNAYPRVIRTGEGTEAVAQVPYAFRADALLAIALNTNRLAAVQADYQATVAKVIRAVSGGSDQIAPPAPLLPDADARARARHQADTAAYRDQVVRFQVEELALRRSTIEVELRPIPSAGLRLDENRVQASVLAPIVDLIE